MEKTFRNEIIKHSQLYLPSSYLLKLVVNANIMYKCFNMKLNRKICQICIPKNKTFKQN